MQKAVKTMLALTAVLAATAVQAVSFPIGTYVYAGTLKRYDNRAMTAEDEMTIEAVSTNGNILAVATVTDPDGEGVNFRLEVPVATSATATAAAVGDAPVCVVRSLQGVRAAASEKFPPVLCASAVTNCSIRYAKSMEFPYSGEEKVCIPEDYLANIAALMDEYGHSEYSANADWDGDGQDNYKEFMAGTNPFDASDYLRVTSFSVGETSNMLAFEYVGGHVYALKSATTLTNPDWATQKFSVDSEDGEQQRATYTAQTEYAEDEDVGVAELYVTPVPDATQMFYKVEVK